MDRKRVAVVILNWNTGRLTEELILGLDCARGYQVIVVDNGSSDNSISILEKIQNITLLKSSKNLGFAGGNNIGIRYALEEGAEYIWLLNNDTIPKENALEEMLAVYKESKNQGIVGSTLLNSDNSVQCYGGGYLDSWSGNIRHIKNIDHLNKLKYLCAASLLVHKDIFEFCGLLDEQFFLYWEDSEFSWRVKKLGFSLYVAQKSLVIHKMGYSTNKIPKQKIFHYNRSSLLFAQITQQRLTIYWGIFLRLSKSLLSFKIKNFLVITRALITRLPPHS